MSFLSRSIRIHLLILSCLISSTQLHAGKDKNTGFLQASENGNPRGKFQSPTKKLKKREPLAQLPKQRKPLFAQQAEQPPIPTFQRAIYHIQTGTLEIIDQRGHEETQPCRRAASLAQTNKQKVLILELDHNDTEATQPLPPGTTQSILHSLEPDIFTNLQEVELGNACLGIDCAPKLARLPKLKKILGWAVTSTSGLYRIPSFEQLEELELILYKEPRLETFVTHLRAFPQLRTLWIRNKDGRNKEGILRQSLLRRLQQDTQEGKRSQTPSVIYLP